MTKASRMPQDVSPRVETASGVANAPNWLQLSAATEFLSTHTPIYKVGRHLTGTYPISKGGLL